ncbi:unnamed protein product [Malus baccata var. baccata]
MNDEETQEIIQARNQGKKKDFRIRKTDGMLMQESRMYVLNNAELKKEILDEAHISAYTMHPGVERKKPFGLMQSLPIPQWKWENITIDFVYKLPCTQNGYDGIWVIVDRLTKSAYFIPVKEKYSLSRLAKLFILKIVKYHGVSVNIISDRDPRFTSKFWVAFQEAFGMRLLYSMAYHPQTDGQSERTIQTLKDMLRSLVLQFGDSWHDCLDLMEFAYNNSYHLSIGMAPFEALYGKSCRTPLCWSEVGERVLMGLKVVDETTQNIQIIKSNLKAAQDGQKSFADKHATDRKYNVDPSHVIPPQPLEINPDLTYDEKPVTLLDWKD